MDSVALAGVVLFCLLGAVFIGMAIRSRLPTNHLSADSTDAIKLATAIVGTLAAIALGFVTSSAKTASTVLRPILERLLPRSSFLTESWATTARKRLVLGARLRISCSFKLDRPASIGFADDSALEAFQDKLRALVPATTAQRSLQARALEVSGKIAETHGHRDETGSEVFLGPFVAILFSGFHSSSALSGSCAAEHDGYNHCPHLCFVGSGRGLSHCRYVPSPSGAY
jgi:hypothetical protein